MSEKRKTISPTLANYFKSLRLNKDLKQQDLAEKLNITGAYIGYIENAKRLPSVSVCEAYANFFDLKFEDVLNLRVYTIIETVDLLGDATPKAIMNERNMIAHSAGHPKGFGLRYKTDSETSQTILESLDTEKLMVQYERARDPRYGRRAIPVQGEYDARHIKRLVRDILRISETLDDLTEQYYLLTGEQFVKEEHQE